MSGDERPAPYHRLRPASDDGRFPGALEWLADLNPDAWRKGPRRKDCGEVNYQKIAEAAGIAVPTFWRHSQGISPLTEPVMSALKALAMQRGVAEGVAQGLLFEFIATPRAPTSEADLKEMALRQVGAAA